MAVVADGEIRTPAGDAPLIPVLLIAAGGLVAWFGAHYWRDQHTKYPSTVVKSVLQGKGVPGRVPAPSTAVADITAAESAVPGVGTGPGQLSGGGAQLAADARKYVGKVKYVWGGANPATGWDCSGLVNYVACHDVGLNIPGYKGGTFTGKTHGPTVAGWLGWSGVEPVTSPAAGDLVVWGPDAHMGIALDSTRFVSAENQKYGTAIADIAGFGPVPPVFLRLRQATPASAKGGTPSKNKHLASLLAARYGWAPSQNASQFAALEKLWTRESGWDNLVINPGSGAFGVAQALGHGGAGQAVTVPQADLPGGGHAYKVRVDDYPSKAANAGAARPQIEWGLSYIKQRYGSPAAAWAHEEQNGWY